MRHLSRRPRTRNARCARISSSTKGWCTWRWDCPRNSSPRHSRARAFSAGRLTSWNSARTTGSSDLRPITSARHRYPINLVPCTGSGNIACMLFSQTLASIQPQGNAWSAGVGEDWSQGRATFGGMVAALGNECMRRLVPAERKLRGLETVFAGPALAGAVRIEAEVLRVGKAVTIASARLWSADKIAATLTGTYGVARSAAFSRLPAAPPGVSAAQDLPQGTTGAGAPAFAQHFDLRWAEGAWPFSGSSSNK